MATQVDGPANAEVDAIKLNVAAPLLEKCIEYMYYKTMYDSVEPEHRPAFVVAPEMALPLIHVATHLQL